MWRVVCWVWAFALIFPLLFLCCTNASTAQATGNLESFKAHVLRFVEVMNIKVSVSVLEDKLWKGFEAQTQCKGVAEEVRCNVIASDADLAKASHVFIEYMAAHEACHIKLRHYALDALDFITRSEEIERDADRCAREYIGWDKFIPSMAQRLMDSDKQFQTVPTEALERAIRKVYGDTINFAESP
jgi:hypothetical protein